MVVCGLLLISLIVMAVLWGPAFWQIVTDQKRFRMWLESYGAYAALLFVATQFIQVVIFFIPGEVTQFVGGYLFGTWLGLALSYLGITLGAVTAFYLARLFAYGALEVLVDRQTVRRFDRVVYGKSGFWPMFLLFMLPGIPKDLLCYIAGLTPMHVVTFLVISTLGRFPGVLLSSLFGESVAERNWATIRLTVGITLGFTGIAYMLRKPIERMRKQYLVTTDEKKRMDP